MNAKPVEKLVTPMALKRCRDPGNLTGSASGRGDALHVPPAGPSTNGHQVQGLPLPAFYFLSAAHSPGDRALDIDAARELRTLIPLVSVFGGAMGNQIMEGKLTVGKLYPICQETAFRLPPRFLPTSGSLPSVWELLQEEAYTRRDDEKVERLRQLIAPEARALLEAEAGAKRAQARGGDNLDTDVGQHQQMRYYVETFAAGTQFYWRLGLRDVNDIEWEAFLSALIEFSKYHIGA